MIKINVFKKPSGNQRSGLFFSLFLNKILKQGSMICPDEISVNEYMREGSI